MATIVLSAAGAAIGGGLGGTVMGLSSMAIGRAVGATIGRSIDQRLSGAGSAPVETGRVERLRITGAGEGATIADVHGRVRLAGQVIWASEFAEHVSSSGGGRGKGGGAPEPKVREYSYTVSLALGLCRGPVSRIGRVWADGREIDRETIGLSVYHGGEDQIPDPTMEAALGAGNVPAYRGLAYVVIEDLELGTYGNRVPVFNFEVIRGEAPAAAPKRDLAGHVGAVALLPGTGEYSLATTPVWRGGAYANMNAPGGGTDFSQSLDALQGELPECRSTSLVVSWFGDDLRAGACSLRPMVEDPVTEGREMAWRSGGIGRGSAERVPTEGGAPVYGGTPADGAVAEAIGALGAAGQAVMFYPFILMTQQTGNGLGDPYGGAEQAILPWRGRITTEVAPGRPGSGDGTASAEAEVARFFGTAGPGDFRVLGSGKDLRIDYAGPDEWAYRRFILHYAHLCAATGGVEAFCIGSEMRGLTRIRGTGGRFPAVEALIALAADVRSILGAGVKISYAADWSEYFGYHPQDGSGDVLFHLDALWADPNVDFIGIDNYMPLSDWRDAPGHADEGWGAIYDLGYLKSNVAGGEGYDWYYASRENREAQVRSPISDGAHGEPWVYRYKDLVGWWSNPHHDRVGGVRSGRASPWVPGSKPIVFTEIGCAAIDKGTNQPNKFLDPKSSESALPWHSDGRRDDFIQVQYTRALNEYWRDGANNPVSPIYGGEMVDVSRSHVWAWDARPFPQFPGLPEVWSDGDNYARGHWLTGRSGSRTLASVVERICLDAGLSAVDVEGLHGVVRGVVTPAGTARAALQPLMLAFGFDAVERGGLVSFRARDGVPKGRVAAEEMVADGDAGSMIEMVRAPEAEEVGRVKLTFIGADEGFDTRTAEAVFPGDDTPSVSQTELPIVMTPAEARVVAERWLAEARIGQDRLRMALPPSRMELGAGDVIGAEDALWRIDHVDQTDHQMIEAVRCEPGTYVGVYDGQEVVTARRHLAPGPVEAVFLDLPLLTGAEVPHAPHVAATASPWRGANVFGAPVDAGYELIEVLGARATMGVTHTPLARAAPGRWDNGPALRVELPWGSLGSAQSAALLQGANAMAIGRGTDDVWEVFQFAEAELVEGRLWDLSVRLRGQAGTDGVAPDEWPAGSRVVLLDRALEQIETAPAIRGVERHFMVGPAGRPMTDSAYDHVVRTFGGVGLRPYGVAHLDIRPAGSGIDVTWIRRTRIGGDAWEGVDVPLGEEREMYEVRVVSGGRTLRSVLTGAPSWRYGAEEMAEDAGSGPVRIEVAQVSAVWGAGPYRGIDVT